MDGGNAAHVRLAGAAILGQVQPDCVAVLKVVDKVDLCLAQESAVGEIGAGVEGDQFAIALDLPGNGQVVCLVLRAGKGMDGAEAAVRIRDDTKCKGWGFVVLLQQLAQATASCRGPLAPVCKGQRASTCMHECLLLLLLPIATARVLRSNHVRDYTFHWHEPLL